ncbi:uncharacterized protein SPPG_03066 [Spizellomyces punctatus DAOM BR117]|uniref:Phytanoyl-CoA dioxygenase n=1 Tax=Spizellomyces punctatus (strain DAOM BR117) TaxID=645134 RepID=A0A0L0HJG2_SPIPD|nr:uncharacterized protein SPPG_03066 [Spizellomyces punctatus DAOM BR117]KND01252.1 hypothetical protein SPPG_03066 [Spizellomyces punctatus DAOM BR117]|eukprot:XP_016609291.1 hypothetical protein SPPG_03066 [Spizellomyces punctatus DAOM BR117]
MIPVDTLPLTHKQLETYAHEGILYIPNYFSPEEVSVLRAATAEELQQTGRFSSKESHVSKVGCTSQIGFGCGEHPQRRRLCSPGPEDDFLPTANAINFFIYLDTVDEFNGAPMFVPLSHKITVDLPANDPSDKITAAYMSSITENLKYTISKDVLSAAVSEYGLVLGRGQPGDVWLMHPLVYHASPANLSPLDRKVVIVSYNTVHNKPPVEGTRPYFLASREYTPVRPSTNCPSLVAQRRSPKEPQPTVIAREGQLR